MKKNAPLESFDGICNLSNQDKVVGDQVTNAHVSIVFCLILAKKEKKKGVLFDELNSHPT